MPLYTNAGMVQSCLGGNWDRSTDLAAFMSRAHTMLNQVVKCATKKGYTHDADQLTEIETLLSAYYYCLQDKTYQQRTTLRASGQFTGQTGKFTEFNEYIQAACLLDWSRCLATILTARNATLDWAGKTAAEQIDYDQRN